MEKTENLHKQVISQFEGMTVDMDYILCIPAVHAMYQGEEIVVDISCTIRKMTDAFPMEKAELLKQWISLHEQEIVENHHRRGYGIKPYIMIDPLKK